MNIGYKGKVKVSLVKEGHPEKTYHLENEGQPYLFKQLCQALAGLSYALPNFIDAGTVDTGQQFNTYLTYRSPIVRRTLTEDGGVAALQLTSTISHNQVADKNKTAVLEYLALYGDAVGFQSYMALLKLSERVELQPGDLLNVTWQISFSNQNA